MPQRQAGDSHESTLLPGLKPTLEALESAPESVLEVLCRKGLFKNETGKIAALCAKHHIPLKFAPPEELARLASTRGDVPVSSQGVIARLAPKEFTPLETLLREAKNAPLPLLLALDHVQDAGNLGALARTLYALGGGGLILPLRGGASLGPGAMRASAGALRRLPVARCASLAAALDAAEEADFHIYGTGCGAPARKNPGSSLNPFETPPDLPAVIVLGNENRGISSAVAKRCGQFLHIPLARDFDSLNVAQTGAVLIGLCAARRLQRS